MPLLIDQATGQPTFVPDAEVESGIASGAFAYPEAATLVGEEQFGAQATGTAEQLGAAGYTPLDTAESTEFGLELEYGDSPITAGALGVGRALTLGGSDIAAEALGLGHDVDQYAARNVGASTVGEVGGAIGSLFVPGGQYTAAGALGRSAIAYSRAGANASKLARATRAALAGGAEAYAYGAGLSLGEQVRRGEDLSAAAAQALQDGAMAAPYGAVLAGGLDLAGQAYARVKGPLTRQRVARGVMDDIEAQVGDVRAAMQDVTKAEAKVAASQAAVREAEERLVRLQSEGASIDDLITAKGELDELRRVKAVNRTAAGKVAQKNAQKNFAKQANAARAELADNLPMTVLVTRGSVDRIRSFAKKAGKAWRFKDPATIKAAQDVDAALKKFDEMFIESIDPSPSGGGLTRKKIGKDAAGRPAKLENAGVLKDVKAAFLKDPDGARAAIEQLDEAGGRLAQQVRIEDNPFLTWVPEDARRATEAFGYADDAFLSADDIARRVAELSEASTAKKLDEFMEGAKEEFKASGRDVARAERRVKDLESNLRARAKESATVDKAKQKLRAEQAGLEERRALLENADQGKAWADELESLAIEAGALPKEGFTKADIAMAAVDIGIDGASEAEWAVRLHLLTKFLGGGKGVRGALGRMAARGVDIGTGVAAGAAGRLPGGLALSGAVRAMGQNVAGGLRGAVKQKAKTQVAVGDARRMFEGRLDKAIKSINRRSKIPRAVGAIAPHTTLAKTKFAQIDHGTNYAGLDKDTAEFEKRAAELEAVAGGGADTQGFAEKQIDRTGAEGDLAAGVATGAARSLAYLHSKLPPRRYVGADATRRNSSSSEIRSFARIVRYVLDPGALADDLASRTVAPEAAEAVREVYPPLYSRMQLEFLNAISADEKGEKFNASTRTYIGRVLGLPQLYSGLRPSYVGTLQSLSGAMPQPQPPAPRTLKLSTNAPTETGRHLEG